MLDSGATSLEPSILGSRNAASTRASPIARRVRQLPESLLLGFAFGVTYLVHYECLTDATHHHSARLVHLAHEIATFIPYLGPIALIEIAARGALRKALLGIYFVLHILIEAAFLSTRGHLDFAFIGDNLREASSRVGASLVLAAIPTSVRVAGVIELVLVIALLLRDRPTPWRQPTRARLLVALGAAALVVLGVVGRFRTADAVSHFGHSLLRYYGKNRRMARARAATAAAYPFVHDSGPTKLPADVIPASPGARPNVVLIMVESLSAAYVGKTGPDGEPYTPTMDRLIASGLSAPRFYGNSVQTCHGHFATLCSLVPSYRTKEAYIEPLALDCLPRVLRDEGYDTAFYLGDQEENFDGVAEFGKRLGFKETRTAASSSLSEDERAHVWGWGLQDDVFYAWALRNLEARRHPGRPFFVALAPVSNHYPFDEERGRAPIAGEPTEARAVYTSSLRAADRRLARFFELLAERGLAANTLVIVTGDHSFPADEHGSHFNEQGFYEESFRIPLVMVWPGHLPARALDGGAFSQIDIAPTVLDLLAVRGSTAFVGRSVFADGERFLPLVQPYDGQYLGAVRWPWKYSEHGFTGEGRVFDLVADPTESDPLALGAIPPDVARALEDDVERIHLNQALLQSNQIWRE